MKTLTIACLAMTVVVGSAFGGERIDPKHLEVGSSYRLDSLTPMMPEMKEPDPMATFNKIKRIPPGGAIKIDAMEVKYRDTWYKVRAISAQKQVIGAGYINSKDLVNQKLAGFGASSVKVTRGKARPLKPAVDVAAKPYKIASACDLNYRAPGSSQTVNRKVYSVILAKEMSETELNSVTGDLIESDPSLDAAYIYYYLPGTGPSGPFTAGRVLWAPGGVWEDAGSDKRKRYIIEFGDALKKLTAENVVDLPEKKKKAIFVAMMGIVEQGADFTQSRAAVAEKHKVKVSEINKITDEGLLKNWPMR